MQVESIRGKIFGSSNRIEGNQDKGRGVRITHTQKNIPKISPIILISLLQKILQKQTWI